MPRLPAERVQLGVELVAQGAQVAGVIDGICEHLRAEGASGPVGALGAFLEFDAEELADQVTQSVARATEQLGRDRGVEDLRGDEAAGAAEQAEVEVGAVEDQLAGREVGEEGGERGG